MLKIPHLLLAGALWSATPLYAQNAAPISQAARAPIAPGLRREAGAWLFNDSVFAAPGENRGVVGGPVFLSNLRRDKKNKLPLFLPAKTGAPLRFSTLALPDLRQMSAPGFDFGGLQSRLSAQVGAARAAGQVYVAWSLPTVSDGGEASFTGNAQDRVAFETARSLDKVKAAAVLKQLRGVLDAVAPESALLLQVNAADSQSAADIDAAAPGCDAIHLVADVESRDALWPLKMARRVVEEQRDFDLPIFVEPTAPPASVEIAAPARSGFEARLLEFWMGGATGFVLPEAQVPAWAGVIARNAGLFSGAVTLEDAPVLPSLNPRSLQLVEQLRGAGRIPMAARLADSSRDTNLNGDSLFAILDDQTTLETLDGLDKAARNGNTIYLEGTPDLRNAALVTKLSDMTTTTLELLAAPKNELMTLSDAWIFGDARGREIAVTQRLKWTAKTSLAAQARKKKGEDVLEPFSAAKLTGDANGILVAPLGRGRVIWLAHAPSSAAEEAGRRDYYAAIAGTLQGALARYSFDTGEDAVRGGGKIHVALRASKLGTPILAVFNGAATDANLTLSARTDSPVALDLITEREIAARVSGYSSNVQVTVPARGFTWLTFGTKRPALDKERLAPRPKAKTR